MIYLIRTKGETMDDYKVGYAKSFDSRARAYITDNPNVEFLEGIMTYEKTKHRLERQVQREIELLGYEWKDNHGTRTEWFSVPKGTEIHLKDFKACKGRKIFLLDDGE